jgi:hypothetical protein
LQKSINSVDNSLRNQAEVKPKHSNFLAFLDAKFYLNDTSSTVASMVADRQKDPRFGSAG